MDYFFNINDYINESKLPLFKGGNHRFSTLGHDPLIGLVVGTANIMTNTITCVHKIDAGSLELPVVTTNHVIYNTNYSNPLIGTYGLSSLMLASAIDRTIEEPIAFVAALIKQIIHIGTDLYTPKGIQFPGENLVLNTKNIDRIAKYVGFGDYVKIGTSAKIADFINTIISTLHTLTHDLNDGVEPEVFSVRTRKIILYSNAIAEEFDMLWVGINAAIGNETSWKDLDIGGVTVYLQRYFSDTSYIQKIKEEFVFGKFKDLILQSNYKLEETIWE